MTNLQDFFSRISGPGWVYLKYADGSVENRRVHPGQVIHVPEGTITMAAYRSDDNTGWIGPNDTHIVERWLDE